MGGCVICVSEVAWTLGCCSVIKHLITTVYALRIVRLSRRPLHLDRLNPFLQQGELLDHLGGACELEQHALSTKRRRLVAFWMNEGHVVPARALPYAARREPNAAGCEVLHRGRNIIDPKPNVIERRHVHLWRFIWIQRLHQIDLDRKRPDAEL